MGPVKAVIDDGRLKGAGEASRGATSVVGWDGRSWPKGAMWGAGAPNDSSVACSRGAAGGPRRDLTASTADKQVGGAEIENELL